MPPNDANKIGEAFVEVRADTGKLSSGLKQAEGQVTASSKKMEGGLKGVGDAATKVQGVFAKLAIPTAIIGSLLGIVAMLKRVIDSATEAQAALANIGKEQNKVTGEIVERLRQTNTATREQKKLAATTLEQMETQQKAIFGFWERFAVVSEEFFRRDSDQNELRLQWMREQMDLLNSVGNEGSKNLTLLQSAQEIESERAAVIERQREGLNQIFGALSAINGIDVSDSSLLAFFHASEVERTQKGVDQLLGTLKAISDLKFDGIADSVNQALENLKEFQQVQQDIIRAQTGMFGDIGTAEAIKTIARNLERLKTGR